MSAARNDPRGPTRFAGLDGLRGVAAFAVVVYHTLMPLGLTGIASHGYLAVDFFFLLSGFVIAEAYDGKLRHGLGVGPFLVQRARRLYPMVWLGMALGLLVAVMKMVVEPAGHGVTALFAFSAVLGLLLLPFGAWPASSMAFPLNGPAWSLFFELAVNAVYAAVAPRMTVRRVLPVVAVSAAWLAHIACTRGNLDAGGDLESFYIGAVRVVFAFFAGWMLHRLTATRMPPWRGAAGLAVLLLCATLFLPPADSGGVFDAVAALVIFPLVLLLAIAGEPTGRMRALAMFAGAVSYPLYLVHYPVMRVFQYLAQSRGLDGFALHALAAAGIAAMLGLAVAAHYLYDQPIQRALRRGAHGSRRALAR